MNVYMSKKTKIVGSVVLVSVIFVSVFFLFDKGRFGQDQKVPSNTEDVYVHQDQSFSFVYPKHLALQILPEEGGTSLVFGTPDKGVVIQLFVYDEVENIVITPDLVRQNFPELSSTEIGVVDIASGITGVSFLDSNTPNQAKHVWFGVKGKVFQFTFFPQYEDSVGRMVSSLTFNP